MGAPGVQNKHPPLSAHLLSCMCILQSVRVRVKLQNPSAPPTFSNPDLEGKGKKSLFRSENRKRRGLYPESSGVKERRPPFVQRR